MEKLNPEDAYKKNIFRPVYLGDLPEKTLIPNSEAPATIDKFLSQLNLPETWSNEDCFLCLGTEHYNDLLEETKKVVGYSGRFTRYRDFLLLFDEDIPKGLLFVGLIFDKISELELLQSQRVLNLKEQQTLDYLKVNRFKKDKPQS